MTSLQEILETLVPFLVVAGGGLPLLFAGVKVAAWRNRRAATRVGGIVIHEPMKATYPRQLVAEVKSHRR